MVGPQPFASPTRRVVLAAAASAVLGGCAPDPSARPPAARSAGSGLVTLSRTLPGGFESAAQTNSAVPGTLPRAGVGRYVKLQAPTAVALRGQDLLVADAATRQIWRVDLVTNLFQAVRGAPPVMPDTVIELGADFSAWVLDRSSRRLVQIPRELGQTASWSTAADAPGAVGFALADGGAVVLVADAALGQWAELRGRAGLSFPVRPRVAEGQQPPRVDAIAAYRDRIFVLDRTAAVVNRVDRQGRVLDSIRHPMLAQATGLAVDRWGRIFTAEASALRLWVLQAGAEARPIEAADLGVQQIGGFAVDEAYLAVSDRLVGQVHILTLGPGA